MNNNNSLIDLETARARHPSRSPSGAGLARRRKGRERMVQPDQRLQDRRDERRRLGDQDVQHDMLRTARRRGGADADPSRQERGSNPRGQAPRWTSFLPRLRLVSARYPPRGITVRASTDFIAAASPIVRKSLEYIRLHIGDTFGLTQIADEIGASRATVSRLFEKELGRAVGAEILRQRLNIAKKLLAEDSLSIAEIAFRTGFCNPAYFTNTFRRATGQTPKSWRASWLLEIRRQGHESRGTPSRSDGAGCAGLRRLSSRCGSS